MSGPAPHCPWRGSEGKRSPLTSSARAHPAMRLGKSAAEGVICLERRVGVCSVRDSPAREEGEVVEVRCPRLCYQVGSATSWDNRARVQQWRDSAVARYTWASAQLRRGATDHTLSLDDDGWTSNQCQSRNLTQCLGWARPHWTLRGRNSIGIDNGSLKFGAGCPGGCWVLSQGVRGLLTPFLIPSSAQILMDGWMDGGDYLSTTLYGYGVFRRIWSVSQSQLKFAKTRLRAC